MQTKTEHMREQVLRMSGVNPLKCMRCGKCTATCPSYDFMEYHPHEFVYMVESGDLTPLLQSSSVYQCLSCFACVDRCPRGVEPAKHMRSDGIPALLDEQMPQQAIVSALRKYAK